jgi:hypothetical protein
VDRAGGGPDLGGLGIAYAASSVGRRASADSYPAALHSKRTLSRGRPRSPKATQIVEYQLLLQGTRRLPLAPPLGSATMPS